MDLSFQYYIQLNVTFTEDETTVSTTGCDYFDIYKNIDAIIIVTKKKSEYLPGKKIFDFLLKQ